ncbi:MAG: FCD domain-containing protein [Terrimesophilobacter sp.]
MADNIRARILSGQLADGEHLPKAEVLRAEFGVGKPAMREAMRILESEQLVTVLRGNRGGARVRAPRATNTAYSLGLVLASHDVNADDVRLALSELEPIAAELCARTSDQAPDIIRELEKSYQACEAAFEAGEPVDGLLREFHVRLAANCGNQTIAIVLGALEALWASHLASSADKRGDEHGRSKEVLSASIRDHGHILDLIRKGDAAGARAVAIEHASKLYESQSLTNKGRSIDTATLRTVLSV